MKNLVLENKKCNESGVLLGKEIEGWVEKKEYGGSDFNLKC